MCPPRGSPGRRSWPASSHIRIEVSYPRSTFQFVTSSSANDPTRRSVVTRAWTVTQLENSIPLNPAARALTFGQTWVPPTELGEKEKVQGGTALLAQPNRGDKTASAEHLALLERTTD